MQRSSSSCRRLRFALQQSWRHRDYRLGSGRDSGRAPGALYEARLARARSEAEALGKALAPGFEPPRDSRFSRSRGRSSRCSSARQPDAFGSASRALAFVAFVAFVVWHGRVLAREDAASRAAAVNARRGAARERALPRARRGRPALPGARAPLRRRPRPLRHEARSTSASRSPTRASAKTRSRASSPQPGAPRNHRTPPARRARARPRARPAPALRSALVRGRRAASAAKRTRSVPFPIRQRLIEWAESREGVVVRRARPWGARSGSARDARRARPLDARLSAVSLARRRSSSSFTFCFARAPACTRAFNACSSTEGAFRSYGPMLRLVEELSLEAPLLAELKSATRSNPEARRRPRWRGSNASSAGSSSATTASSIPFVNLVTLWDVHCTLALERWRESVRGALADWFARARRGRSALVARRPRARRAGLRFPEVRATGPLFVADALGHPLIDRRTSRDERRFARNEGDRAARHRLEHVGQEHAPCAPWASPPCSRSRALPCARAGSRIAPLTIRTSVRVTDSLERGVSHFLRRGEEACGRARRERGRNARLLSARRDPARHELARAANRRALAARRAHPTAAPSAPSRRTTKSSAACRSSS